VDVHKQFEFASFGDRQEICSVRQPIVLIPEAEVMAIVNVQVEWDGRLRGISLLLLSLGINIDRVFRLKRGICPLSFGDLG